jgi:hypothetical protein
LSIGLSERLKLQWQAGRQCSPACTSHHTGGADKPGRMHVQLPASCWQPRAARQQHTQVWVCDQLSCCCGVLLQVLETQGHSILSPSDRSGLHPLVVPLSTFSSQGAGMSSLRCLQQLTAPNGRLGYQVHVLAIRNRHEHKKSHVENQLPCQQWVTPAPGMPW